MCIYCANALKVPYEPSSKDGKQASLLLQNVACLSTWLCVDLCQLPHVIGLPLSECGIRGSISKVSDGLFCTLN